MRLLLALVAAVAMLSAAEVKLGKPLTQKEPIAIAKLLGAPAGYVGKTVQVKGKATSVCEEMGCWIELAGEDGKQIRIKVEDGVIVFPKDAPGKTVTAEGKFTKSGDASYQIEGTGAVIE